MMKMSKKEIAEKVLDMLQAEYELPKDIDIMRFNYVDSGFVDSLGLVRFLSLIMDEFDIDFDDDEMLSPEIRVVENLVNLIANKIV